MWPDAPVYTFFPDRARYGALPGWRLAPSPLQAFPTGAGRIREFYGRESEVVHPPVDVDAFEARPLRGDHWLFVGRLSAYKRADVAVMAFARTRRRLIVVGEGRERDALERLATDNVVFTGRVDEATKRDLLASARGFVLPADEDFGIVCVEALASGAPVIALNKGGAPQIVRDGVDGPPIGEPDADLIAAGVGPFPAPTWPPSQ